MCKLQGSAQISLAEFTTQQDGNSKWYNIISRQIMNETDAEESLLTVKEESSDESTVISSQTSTLTRNQGKFCIIKVTSMKIKF